jgi:hypothetical protein
LVSLEAELSHISETQSSLEERVERLRGQSYELHSPSFASEGASEKSQSVRSALSCCEEQLRATKQQSASLREHQAVLMRQHESQQQVIFEAAPPKSPYDTQSRWFSQDHLWNMHTALWIMLPPDSNIIIEFTFEGLFLCEGCEAAERIKYFRSAGIDFTVPEGHQGLVYDTLCDYVDAIRDCTYHSLTWNCQHFAGELYSNLVRGLQNKKEWYKCKDFLFTKISDRWKSDWGRPTGDPHLYGSELQWRPWAYNELWPTEYARRKSIG